MRLALTLALIMGVLSACQSVPAERKNNCACVWESPEGLDALFEGENV